MLVNNICTIYGLKTARKSYNELNMHDQTTPKLNQTNSIYTCITNTGFGLNFKPKTEKQPIKPLN